MNAPAAAQWMLANLLRDGCIYQDDVVDVLTKSGAYDLLRENADGNDVLDRKVLEEFRNITQNAVWVKPDGYWRWRVEEDEPGREARG